jgi:hypothetical protein
LVTSKPREAAPSHVARLVGQPREGVRPTLLAGKSREAAPPKPPIPWSRSALAPPRRYPLSRLWGWRRPGAVQTGGEGATQKPRASWLAERGGEGSGGGGGEELRVDLERRVPAGCGG